MTLPWIAIQCPVSVYVGLFPADLPLFSAVELMRPAATRGRARCQQPHRTVAAQCVAALDRTNRDPADIVDRIKSVARTQGPWPAFLGGSVRVAISSKTGSCPGHTFRRIRPSAAFLQGNNRSRLVGPEEFIRSVLAKHRARL